MKKGERQEPLIVLSGQDEEEAELVTIKAEPPVIQVPNQTFLAKGHFSNFHKIVLFNQPEYCALFRVHRPMQTDEQSVENLKRIQARFGKLLGDVTTATDLMTKDYEACLSSIQQNLEQENSELNKKLERDQQMISDRCRRAFRTNLCNAILLLAKDYDVSHTITTTIQSLKVKTNRSNSNKS
jgi:hypothetical protein